MTAALILTTSSRTIACVHCNAPWPREAAQCPGCGRRDPAASSSLRACERCGAWDGPEHVTEECDGILANRSRPTYDALRAQLAAVTAERDAAIARAEAGEVALRVVALWLGGPHQSPQPDDVAALARAKGAELDALRAAVVEHLAADAALTDAFESARSISANSSALAEVMAAWKAHGVAIDRAQKARHALNALLPTGPA